MATGAGAHFTSPGTFATDSGVTMLDSSCEMSYDRGRLAYVPRLWPGSAARVFRPTRQYNINKINNIP